MKVLQLPNDILLKIIDEYLDVIPLLSVNKNIYQLCQEKLKKLHATYNRMNSYFERCRHSQLSSNFYWNCFHSVVTLEECDFLFKKYSKNFGSDTFLSRVRYTAANTYQIPAETWYNYLNMNEKNRESNN